MASSCLSSPIECWYNSIHLYHVFRLLLSWWMNGRWKLKSFTNHIQTIVSTNQVNNDQIKNKGGNEKKLNRVRHTHHLKVLCWGVLSTNRMKNILSSLRSLIRYLGSTKIPYITAMTATVNCKKKSLSWLNKIKVILLFHLVPSL